MSDKLFDPDCAFNIVRRPNLLVPWYLMASYAYYVEDEPILSDALYDSICTRLDDEWDTIVHAHKHKIDRSALSAGTGFQMKQEDYPSIVKGAIGDLRANKKESVSKRKKGASSNRT